ncbi:MAG: TolC family protein [Candidatus Solibacter usitatus]|nr:TolC family protein [Candidatus Solibacter usitatus]
MLLLPPLGAGQRVTLSRVTEPYQPRDVAPVNLANSNRIESLLRAGNLYLSLQDAIALALENNLDIELQRYGAQISDANILRARAGGLLRGVPPSVQQGPASAPTQRGQDTGITQSAAAQASAAAGGGTGTVITQTGTVIPNLDPVLTGFVRWAHNTNPQTSTFVSGTNTLVNRNDLANFSFQQGFLSGTTVSLGLSNSHLTSTSLRAELNPSTTSSLNLNVTQKLLQGFGLAVNNRNIVVARNNREVSDLVFKQQVITTVSAIINLYWDLVSFNEDVKVKQKALDLYKKQLVDNQKQVEIGTLAPIEVVRAEAEVANAEQDLTISLTRVLQQEMILKSALSRTGVASPAIADARVIPTDRLSIPENEPVEPIQDLVAQARQARPELAQRRIQIENDKINLKGSRSQLLPTLDAVVAVANNGLAGELSALPLPVGSPPRTPTTFFIGGYGTVLNQLFRRNFPDYSLALQMNIPLRNRSAQADMVLDQLSMRQREIGLQQLENSIRLDVQNALIALQQSRATYQAASKTRVLREQTLDAEQKKYTLGASTLFNVILVQRDLVTAQAAEVSALANYSRARVQMDVATGRSLEHNNIAISEAFRGQVSRAPSPIQ